MLRRGIGHAGSSSFPDAVVQDLSSLHSSLLAHGRRLEVEAQSQLREYEQRWGNRDFARLRRCRQLVDHVDSSLLPSCTTPEGSASLGRVTTGVEKSLSSIKAILAEEKTHEKRLGELLEHQAEEREVVNRALEEDVVQRRQRADRQYYAQLAQLEESYRKRMPRGKTR